MSSNGTYNNNNQWCGCYGYGSSTETCYSTLQDVMFDFNLASATLKECIASDADFVDIIAEYTDGIEDKGILTTLFGRYIIPKCWDSVVDITTAEEVVVGDHDDLMGRLAE